ncbi:MAG: phosphate propanoyltransferase [Candidatus Portnoybacteria bacterium]|nr:phosphate propanoyltransferase [Candidatus Portnoybacteria bacterium]
MKEFLGEVLAEVSARHVHLSKKDLNELFGQNYELKEKNRLSQPGLFAAQETVIIRNKDKEIKNVRIVGPCRKETQIEISRTDAYYLDINPPVKKSGNLENTPGITIIGPKGEIQTEKGVIISQRHIHLTEEKAKEWDLKENDTVSAEIPGERETEYRKIVVRIDPEFDLAIHLDTDEGNAAGVTKNTKAKIYK